MSKVPRRGQWLKTLMNELLDLTFGNSSPVLKCQPMMSSDHRNISQVHPRPLLSEVGCTQIQLLITVVVGLCMASL